MNNSDTFNPIDQSGVHHDANGQKGLPPPRRKFDNQYNNKQYLVHPEKTYTQKILNLIFEPKENPAQGEPHKKRQAEGSPGKNAVTFKESEPPKKSAASKTDPKSKSVSNQRSPNARK